eukprot:SRR837773.19593.p3 GENE.SRR837773.19593~~SRR837773.19593.p3  ORF type:complete len:138 (-),score=26.70 SRR837773.19593:57-470(-)
MHKECHRCCDCGKQITGAFFKVPQLSDSKKVHQCRDCREKVLQRVKLDAGKASSSPSTKPDYAATQIGAVKPMIVHVGGETRHLKASGKLNGSGPRVLVEGRGSDGPAGALAYIGVLACSCCAPGCSWAWTSDTKRL